MGREMGGRFKREGLYADSILKSGNISLRTKVRLVKAMVFPLVIYGCELSANELMLLNCGVGEDS